MLEKKEQIPSATTDKFCDAEKEVREKVENLSLAQSQLLLLGENKANNYLTEFARKTEYYLRETSKPKITKTLKNIGENHNEVKEIRKLFYSEMSSIYKNLAFNKRLK